MAASRSPPYRGCRRGSPRDRQRGAAADGDFVINPDIDLTPDAMRRALIDAVGDDGLDLVEATRLARRVDRQLARRNAFLLGYAHQKGLIPLARDSLVQAIEINGAAVEMNKTAFFWGALAAVDRERVNAVIESGLDRKPPCEPTLDDAISSRVEFLTRYQDQRYADRYLASVKRVQAAEAGASTGSTALTEAYARSLFKLMTYKDEYEVARLHSDPAFARRSPRTSKATTN